MGIFSSESEAERIQRKDAAQARKEAERKRRQQEFDVQERARREAEFRASPPGLARTSHHRGDALLQISLDLEDVKSHVIAMDSAWSTRHANDVSEILNAICAEGWDLHSFSTSFVHMGEVSRDRFLASGQEVAVKGRLVGTYVFARKGE
jgi:hypothetical protein